MRKILNLPAQKPAGQSIEQWVSGVVSTIETAAREDAAIDAAEAFVLDHDGYSELETFDPSTVTLEELARAFATFLKYVQTHAPRKE